MSSSNSRLPRLGMDPNIYTAAAEGKIDAFKQNAESKPIQLLLTPNKNTVLHIHFTAETRNLSQIFVQHILDMCPALVLQANCKAETPLHIAARYGHFNMVRMLIQCAKSLKEDVENGIGAEKKLLRATNCESDTALHEAVRYDHAQVVHILTKEDSNHLYSANNAGETPLYMAAERGHQKVVSEILTNCKSPFYHGPNGRTALHAAVIINSKEMGRQLLEAEHLSALVKEADKDGWVPLHHAAYLGHYEMTELLLKHDRNAAYIQDNEGRTPLHIAAQRDHLNDMEQIMLYCPDCSEIADNKGQNALHAAMNGHNFMVGPVGLAILNNARLSNLYNEKDVHGNTPLHLLANAPNFLLSLSIISHPRVDKMAFNKENLTALDVANDNKDSSAAKDELTIDMESVFGRGSHSLAHAPIYMQVTTTLREKAVMLRRLQRFGARPGRRGPAKDGSNQKILFSKDEIGSHLIVATLIATVSFAAGFTLPGGNIEEGKLQGSAALKEKASFQAFMIADTIAFFLSTSAAFIHLFLALKKDSSETNVLFSEAAFSFIFFAMAAMVIAFLTGTYAVLGSSPIGMSILVIGLSFFFVVRNVLMIFSGRYFFRTFTISMLHVIMFSSIDYTQKLIRPSVLSGLLSRIMSKKEP